MMAAEATWQGDATSVVEFLRPLRQQLDAPGVLEVCVNRPGELLGGPRRRVGVADDVRISRGPQPAKVST